MDNLPTSSAPLPSSDAGDNRNSVEAPQAPETKKNWNAIWENLVRLGLGETALRIGTALISVAAILLVVWVMSRFYLKGEITTPQAAAAAPQVTETSNLDAPPPYEGRGGVYAITRITDLHTQLPTHPRFEITEYEVKKGDTIFGIAEKYNLRPQTILWGNQTLLGDDPHNLQPGQKLTILPVDGIYYQWHAGDGLNGVAEFFKVTPDDIVNWPGNSLNKDALGDYASPNIPPGTMLIVPGGQREFVSWTGLMITRTDPAVAKVLGPGFCGTVTQGPVGGGTFVWPTDTVWLSGYDYSPETNHYGIDIGGNMGVPEYAVDAGVVVYAGWNNWGYGNVVVIDHGNGWQSLYAHLMDGGVNVGCGSYVAQGDIIGYMGSTGNSSGPHLHFELSKGGGRVNPWNFLPH